MTGLWLFAYVALPLVLVAMGVAGVVFLVPWIERQDREIPGE
jgi:hypothetical protein